MLCLPNGGVHGNSHSREVPFLSKGTEYIFSHSSWWQRTQAEHTETGSKKKQLDSLGPQKHRGKLWQGRGPDSPPVGVLTSLETTDKDSTQSHTEGSVQAD